MAFLVPFFLNSVISHRPKVVSKVCSRQHIFLRNTEASLNLTLFSNLNHHALSGICRVGSGGLREKKKDKPMHSRKSCTASVNASRCLWYRERNEPQTEQCAHDEKAPTR